PSDPREVEWRRPSYFFFLVTLAGRAIPNRWLSVNATSASARQRHVEQKRETVRTGLISLGTQAQGIGGRRPPWSGRGRRWGGSTDADGDGEVRRLRPKNSLHRGLTKPFP